MKRLSLFLFLFLFFFLILLFYHPSQGKGKIEEEVFTIREKDVIHGFQYVLSIEKEVNDSRMTLSTHILDSILHYKSLDDIDEVCIYLKIINDSPYTYLLQRIYLLDSSNQLFLQNIPYDKDKKCYLLTKAFFESYRSSYKIQIELAKE